MAFPQSHLRQWGTWCVYGVGGKGQAVEPEDPGFKPQLCHLPSGVILIEREKEETLFILFEPLLFGSLSQQPNLYPK